MDASSSIKEKLQAFRNRNERLLMLGLDRVGAARFILGNASALSGPALDVGTGKGVLAIELARIGMEVVSVDSDGDEQELAAVLAREAGVEDLIKFINADAGRLPYKSNHFGCAAMMDVLHHLEKPKPVLLEMSRLVRQGGVVIMADFNDEGFALIARVHKEDGREHHRSPMTLDEAIELLVRDGLLCTSKFEGHFHHVAVLTKEL